MLNVFCNIIPPSIDSYLLESYGLLYFYLKKNLNNSVWFLTRMWLKFVWYQLSSENDKNKCTYDRKLKQIIEHLN